jgi:hypothetical protein
MNRLHHIRETLPKNIIDNYLPNDIEFVLLDYNSSDRLEEWVKTSMNEHIQSGILTYYKTPDATHYLRSHSRSVSFRLAQGHIVCNLDADNFLGKGFAVEMIKEFEQKENMFYTSDLSSKDAYGRVCLLKTDFLAVRGYNEALVGYGYEDDDLFIRLEKQGLKHLHYHNQDFNQAIQHSKFERINNEPIYNKLSSVYLSYIDPFTTKVLFLYNDYTYEYMTLIERGYGRMIKNPSNEAAQNQTRNRIFVKEAPRKSVWAKSSNNLILLKYGEKEIKFEDNMPSFGICGRKFHKIEDKNLITTIVLVTSIVLNEGKSLQTLISSNAVNLTGFGKSKIYRNFNDSEFIVLD